MEYADFSKGFVIKMSAGEKFHQTLVHFSKEKKLPSAFYQGIGTVCEIEIGFFNLSQNKYLKKRINSFCELTSAMGNLSFFEGQPFPHTHVTLGDENYQTFSGHLFEATIATIAEIILLPIDIALIRKQHESINFKCLDLPHVFAEK